MNKKKARIIALYLPQFHPIEENNRWWGKGFTEWTNVGKARPLFKGHYQPKVPADLGYYDLRYPEIRQQQVDLAKDAGIEGFCYWQYYFGGGKMLLEKPFEDVLNLGKPDFPFCLAWANHSWSNKTWQKSQSLLQSDGLLMEQLYAGKKQYEEHFYYNLKAFKDKRYIKVDGKPVFLVFDPHAIPDPKVFITTWNELALENGLPGIHFVGIQSSLSGFYYDSQHKRVNYIPKKNEPAASRYKSVLELGFDAVNSRGLFRAELNVKGIKAKILKYCSRKLNLNYIDVYKYKDIIKHLYVEEDKWNNVYPTLLPNWDRTPRSGKAAIIYHDSTPDLFEQHLKKALELVENKEEDRKLLFLMSWNEWAEGNYVEPDLRYGTGYLDVIKRNIF
ncbi:MULTISPECIES: glycoside hydrolase family 99-like domain-containing protein [Sphingobacterium]|uniref:glycosyltransferase WbsX family protein n=1 Tax=Sphingobacterium TaxID=28453 RepID=UPI00257B5F11|nr:MULTISPECIES: glycoside hydrolase family 99-like domain-containing protein [Sphingobacterium]